MCETPPAVDATVTVTGYVPGGVPVFSLPPEQACSPTASSSTAELDSIRRRSREEVSETVASNAATAAATQINGHPGIRGTSGNGNPPEFAVVAMVTVELARFLPSSVSEAG